MNMPVREEEFNVFSRRRFLTSLPAAGAALVATAAVALDTSDPVLPLFREWVSARKEWYRYADLPGNGNWQAPESKAAEARENAAFLAMIDSTPTSMAGIAARVTVLWDLNGPTEGGDSEEFAEIADQHDNKLIRAIYRAASGTNEIPVWDKVEALA